jgi:capsular polysaccharide biosynthesis protein
MSQQALDLRTSTLIVRRHKILVGIVFVLGILAGGGYAMRYPPMLTSTALVVLPQSASQSSVGANANGAPDPYTATQELVAGSNEVLAGALPDVRPRMSLDALRRIVQVGSLTPYVISISAKSKVADDAEATANAVAISYVRYIRSASSPVGRVSAQLLEPATSAAGPTPLKSTVVYALVGAISGLMVGAVMALAIGRNDRRLRERDQIADSIGVPVLVSLPVSHPSNAAAWTGLLQRYQPGVVDAWRLHKALRDLRLAGVRPSDLGEASGSSLTVLSLSSDLKALALGPQLAVFAASQGIPTALVVGPQQDINVTAVMRAACAASLPGERPMNLQVNVIDHDHGDQLPHAALTVVVAVVDGQNPKVADTLPTTMTVLGVSAGAVTAGQLARVAASAAAADRDIVGIFVADPDSADQTTGRLPQLARSGQHKMPTRMTGAATEVIS